MAAHINPKTNPVERRVGCEVGEFSTAIPGRYTLATIVSEKNKGRFVMPANAFAGDNKTIKLRVWGSKLGAGEKSLHFSVLDNISFDKYKAIHTVKLGNSAGNFYVEIVVTATDRRAQEIQSTYIADSGTAILNNESNQVPFTTERIFRIYGETSQGSDVLTVNRYEMFVCG